MESNSNGRGGYRTGSGRKKIGSGKRRLNVRLNNDMYDQLEQICKDTSTTISDMIENAVWLLLYVNRDIEQSKSEQSN